MSAQLPGMNSRFIPGQCWTGIGQSTCDVAKEKHWGKKYRLPLPSWRAWPDFQEGAEQGPIQTPGGHTFLWSVRGARGHDGDHEALQAQLSF